jgi:hypothetical protein
MAPPEGQQWGAVVDLMREEARQEAEQLVSRYADIAATLTGQPPRSISARARAATSC